MHKISLPEKLEGATTEEIFKMYEQMVKEWTKGSLEIDPQLKNGIKEMKHTMLFNKNYYQKAENKLKKVYTKTNETKIFWKKHKTVVLELMKSLVVNCGLLYQPKDLKELLTVLLKMSVPFFSGGMNFVDFVSSLDTVGTCVNLTLKDPIQNSCWNRFFVVSKTCMEIIFKKLSGMEQK